MTRGSPIVYVGASIVTPLIVYEILAVMGWEAVLGWTYTVLLLLFTTPVGIAAWVLQDARDRGWNGTFWAIVSILAPIPFGPVIYLLARSERRFRSKGAVWYVLYGLVMPVTFLGVSLYTGIGGILVVIAVVIWMGFALVMAAPASQAQAP